METIHIYHTNDLHSHFKDWPRIVELLKKRRQWHEDVGDEVFVFDIGDHIDRWHPLTDATFGKGNVSLLNSANYDGVTIGNNEGITLPFEKLSELYDEANFDVILANLFLPTGQYPDWLKAYKIYETKAQTKIAVIGLTTCFEIFYKNLGWKITEPLAQLEKVLGEVQNKVDVIILLSHLGLRYDQEIAERYHAVDIILGGHTHHILHKGKLINKTLLACAGKFGNYVGHVELQVRKEDKCLSSKEAELYDTNLLPAFADENKMITDLYRMGENLLQEEVTSLDEALSEKELTDMLCEEMLTWSGADCGLANSGLILESLQAGPVTKFDLLKICPHPINPALVEVSGRQLVKIINRAQSEEWLDFKMIGFGFRGHFIGEFVFSGIDFYKGKIFINKIEVQDSETYKLVVPDMFTFGDFFSEISCMDCEDYLLAEFIRDLLARKLHKEE